MGRNRYVRKVLKLRRKISVTVDFGVPKLACNGRALRGITDKQCHDGPNREKMVKIERPDSKRG
jgi:hypothetical protein